MGSLYSTHLSSVLTTTQVFEAMLRVEFASLPGEHNVNNGEFRMADVIHGTLISQQSWSSSVFPGNKVAMSMVMQRLAFFFGRCPKPGCSGKAVSDVRKSTSVW